MINPYTATGQVIDSDTNEGIPSLRIEVWDVQKKTQQPLAIATSQPNGRFTATIDFVKAGFTEIPDLVFTVFRNTQELQAKESSFTWNSESQQDITLTVQKTPIDRTQAKDRVTTEQVMKAADFMKNFNPIGLFSGAKEHAADRLSMIGKVLATALPNMDFKKITLPTNVDKAVVNQDVKTATDYLASQQVTVSEVKPVDKKLSGSTLKDLLTLPINLKAGEKVNLYQEDGNVKYYSVVPSPTATATASNNDEVVKLRQELEASKKELAAIQEKQEQHARVFESKEFQAFLKTQANIRKPNK